MFLSINLLPNHVEQIADGVRTNLLDEDGPPVEAADRPERNVLNEEGPAEQLPRARIRIRSKATASEIESHENVFTIQENQDHESWRQLHRQQKLKRQREKWHLTNQVLEIL